MCPREQFCNEKGATYFAHPILHCRLSLVNGPMGPGYLPEMAVKSRIQIVESVVKLLWTKHIQTYFNSNDQYVFSVYVVRIQKCFCHTVSQFCATPELPSKWQYLNQLKSLPNFIPTLSRFPIRRNWLLFGLLSHSDQGFPQLIVTVRHIFAQVLLGWRTRVIIKNESHPFYTL